MSRQTYISPAEADTPEKVNLLQRSDWERGGYWFLVQPRSVTICKQRSDEQPTEGPVTIPRAVWDSFVGAYQRGQRVRKRTA